MLSIPSVLILDTDDELVLQEKKFLEEDGAKVISSSNPNVVLARLEEINPDLIVLGTEVPMVNGDLPLTVFRSATRVPILVIGHREEMVYMLELGADGCIYKPLNKSLFIATIHSLLRRYWISYNSNSLSAYSLINSH